MTVRHAHGRPWAMHSETFATVSKIFEENFIDISSQKNSKPPKFYFYIEFATCPQNLTAGPHASCKVIKTGARIMFYRRGVQDQDWLNLLKLGRRPRKSSRYLCTNWSNIEAVTLMSRRQAGQNQLDILFTKEAGLICK